MRLKLLPQFFVFLFSMIAFAQNINQPSDYVACDNNYDGIAIFDLSSKDSEILGNQNPVNFQITYHDSLSDAQNGTNPLASPFTNTANPQTIYVRMVGNGVVEMTSFQLIVNTLPTEPFSQDIIVCDDDEQDGITTFDLTIFDSYFTLGQSGLGVTYYESFQDAISGTNAIPNAQSYVNTQPYSQIIFVRIENLDTGCYIATTSSVLYLNVNEQPDITQPTPFVICDDDNDGFATFELASKTPEILANNNPNNFMVSYHETQVDADAGVNGLPPVYNNIVASVQTLYVRVSNQFGDCFVTTMLDLVVATDCVAVSSASIEECSETPMTGHLFDLTIRESEIVNGQDTSQFTFSYFISQSNAEANINAITNTVEYATTLNIEIIYVRVEETATSYFGITELTLRTNPLPEIILEDTYSICGGDSIVLTATFNSQNYNFIWNTGATDPEIVVTTAGTYTVTVTDNTTGCSAFASVEVEQTDAPAVIEPSNIESCDGTVVFDLTQQIPELLNGVDPSTVSITFYNTLVNAYNQSQQITNPESYTVNQDTQTIFVRINNLDNNCFEIVDFIIFSDNCPMTITCGNGPVNTTYCYGNNDNTQFVYESSDGSPLILYFNAGRTEVNWDEVYILDSDGTQLNANLPYGNSGDFAGMTFESSGSTITLVFNSDSTISCAAGNTCCNVPFDFDIFCSSSVGIIDVNAFVDNNTNTIFDANELLFSQGYFTYEVNNDGVEHVVTSSTGHFSIYSENETDVYSISFDLFDDFSGCHQVTTSLFENITVATNSVVTVDFPVVQVQSCEDLAIYLINNSAPPRPGFNYRNYLVLENLGFTTITSGTVEFTHDGLIDYLNIYSINPNYTVTDTANGFTVDFVNLQPGQSESIEISLLCPNSVALGTIVTNTATYLTSTNDLLASNNYSTLSETVVGSYDPNDIMESHGPTIIYDEFFTSDEILYYTIRFQNLGTADAINVRIENLLDAQLDESSFKVLSSSHPYIVTRTNNQLLWQFEDIDLPSESMDADGSKGYVYFKIKPQDGYGIGDVIPNKADIYFDFNAAITTNIFNTEFVESLSINDYEVNGFSMFPNPAKSSLTLLFRNTMNGLITIYDIQGKTIFNKAVVNEISVQLNISEFESGLYFVKLNDGLNEMIKKLIIN